MSGANLQFDSSGPRFLETSEQSSPGGVAIFGVPFDGTTSFRPGARFGPDALRTASVGLETYSPEQDFDYAELSVADLGNIEVPHGAAGPVVECVYSATRKLVESDSRPLMLGGEHSVTVGAVRAMAERYEDLLLVQIDAHADLRDGYLGDHFSHASAMRRSLEHLKADSLIQVGIRSGTAEEFAEMRESGRLLRPDAAALSTWLHERGARPIYLTVDLDAFDPAYFPGTGTPEPGGIDWKTFRELLAAIPSSRLVGCDAVELAPQLDATGCSSVLAAKVVRELIIRLGNDG